ARATGNQVAQVMQGTGEDAVASAAFAASRTRSISVVTASSNDPRLGQIFRFGDPHGAVRQVLSGTRHGKALLGQVFPARKLQHLPRSVTVNLPVLMLKTPFLPLALRKRGPFLSSAIPAASMYASR